jgi:hypothetical protein
MEIVVGVLLAIGFGIVIALLMKRPAVSGGNELETERLKADLDRRIAEYGELKTKLSALQSEKDELSGKGKQLYDNFKNLEADVKVSRQERDSLQRQVNEYQTDEKRREKEFNQQLEKLEAAKKSLEDERTRVIREDEQERAQVEEERDRIWAEHEKNVIAGMTELCKLPQYFFSAYTNTSLPDGFDGSLKPDFMIEFLDQYVIFDAKKSKQESLQTYITNTVKTTVAKVKKNPKIATMIFLVVPTEAVSELKAHHYVHDGYTLYVISPEAIAPILASLKRITAYEFAEQMDPKQRENIVNFLADLDVHVSMRNSADVLFTKQGAELLGKAQKIDPALAQEIAQKKQEKIRMLPNIFNSVFKKLVASIEAQEQEVEALTSPSAPVRKKDLKAAEEMLSESVFN